MLLYRSHWRIAFERDPEKEGRLLGFADTAAVPHGEDKKPEHAESPDETAKAEAPAEAHATPETIQGDVRGEVGQSLDPGHAGLNVPAEDTEGEIATGEKKEASQINKDLDEIIQQAENTSNLIAETLERMEGDEMAAAMKAMKIDESAVERWKRDIDLLKAENEYCIQDARLAQDLQKLWRMEASPEQLLHSVEEYAIVPENGTARTLYAVLKELAVHKPHATESVWPTLSNATKYQMIQEISDQIQMRPWISTTKRKQKEAQELIENHNTTRVESAIKEIELFAGQAEGGRGIGAMLGSVRFYSVMDYVHGVQQYWEALKSTWDQRGKRYSATIAARIGKTLRGLPFYGIEVDTILDGDLEHTRQEEAKKMQEHLEHTKANWHVTFHELETFLNNPNKARGILDYAAEHGWLYEIDELGYSNDRHPLFTTHDSKVVTLEDICTDWTGKDGKNKLSNYFDDLRSRNSQGREKEIESGKAKEKDNENVPRFIKLLEHELDDHNLWTAAGVVRRAMERVLMGEVAPWLLTTIMKKLREYPHLRRVTPVAFWDIVGKESMYTTTFSLGWAKARRGKLRKWCKSGDEKHINSTELQSLGGIERAIIEKDPETDYRSKEGRDKLARLMAKVLAAQTIRLPKGHISIFESQYAKYREGCSRHFISFPKALEEDSDAFTERTEQPLLSFTGFDQILKYDSTRKFNNPTLAAAFLEKLVIVSRELKGIPDLSGAYRNYTKEVSLKIDKWSNGFAQENSIQQMLNAPDSTGKSIFCGIFIEGLLTWKAIERSKYKDQFVVQMHRDFNEYYNEHYTEYGWPKDPTVKAAAADSGKKPAE